MNKHVQQGNWNFELKQVFARKTNSFGEPYTASAVITVTNGTPNIELLINKSGGEFGKQDIREFLTGFEKADFVRVKQNTKREYTRD